MDFLVEFLRTLINVIVLVSCCIGGVFIGKGLRDRKNKKLAEQNPENK